MGVIGWFRGKGPSGFGYNSTSDDVTQGFDLSDKTYLLTGCNSGIGLDTLRVLTARGAHLIAAARTEEKAAKALESVSAANGTPVACELSEPDSVRACVEAVQQTGRTLDAILCNAGIMALPKLTLQHGYEMQFFTNHIGHFILVTGLVDQLSEQGRVVMVSSEGHRLTPKGGIQFDNLDGSKGYNPWTFYGQSKLSNILFARQLSKRFEGTGRTANALHPGVIHTNLGRNMNNVLQTGFAAISGMFLKTIPQGAATQCYVAVHPAAATVTGSYFSHSNRIPMSRHARDYELAKKLWEKSEEIVSKV
ncbi:MAG: SDR family NAD(P)-dependent oxidoreductase [Deltaproteobacteria bacterium]|nr:MAG: SDR family NAD(P)-dependent oxidoreductase [Deltaproteobacteria bacterium]